MLSQIADLCIIIFTVFFTLAFAFDALGQPRETSKTIELRPSAKRQRVDVNA